MENLKKIIESRQPVTLRSFCSKYNIKLPFNDKAAFQQFDALLRENETIQNEFVQSRYYNLCYYILIILQIITLFLYSTFQIKCLQKFLNLFFCNSKLLKEILSTFLSANLVNQYTVCRQKKDKEKFISTCFCDCLKGNFINQFLNFLPNQTNLLRFCCSTT